VGKERYPEESTMLLLLIEDDADIRDSVTQVLVKEAGLMVLAVKDGVEALELLLNSRILPDGILLDLMLPRLDGYGFLSKKAEYPELRGIPVIAVTAMSSVKCRSRDELASCCLIIQKPFDLDQLMMAIRNLPKPPTV
jgi:two-component system chemotaxis response regulator CheY